MQRQTTSELFSDLAADPDFAEIVEMFVEEVPNRVSAILSAFEAGNLEEVGVLAHQIKGAAAGYGFAPVGSAAAALETAVKNDLSVADIESFLDDFSQICASVRAGAPATDTP